MRPAMGLVAVMLLTAASVVQAAGLGRGYLVDATDTYPPGQGHISQFVGGNPPDYWFINLTNYDGTALDQSMFAPGSVFTIQQTGGDVGGVAVNVLYSDASWGDGVMLVQIAGGAFNKGQEIGIYPGDVSHDLIVGDPPPDMGPGSGGTGGGSGPGDPGGPSGPGGGTVTVNDVANAKGYVSGGIAALSSIAGLVLAAFFSFWLVRKTMRWAKCIDGQCGSGEDAHAKLSDHDWALIMNDLHGGKMYSPVDGSERIFNANIESDV